ncbi:MAG: hypothetical protein ABIQ52_09850 [Vicinamibacterales bacterium]
MRGLLGALFVLLTFATARAQQVEPSTFAELRWRSIGPPRSGYISSPAGVPNIIYVGTGNQSGWSRPDRHAALVSSRADPAAEGEEFLPRRIDADQVTDAIRSLHQQLSGGRPSAHRMRQM